MTLTHVNGHIHVAHQERRSAQNSGRDAFTTLRLGQQVEVGVLQRFDTGSSYLVALAGNQHVMDSSVQLAVGGRIRAVVVAVGDRLELRYLDSSESPSARDDDHTSDDSDPSVAPPTLFAALEAKYRITLRGEAQSVLQRAVAGAADPTAMALGGLYLAKVGAPISESALAALHSAQRSPSAGAAARAVVRDISAMVDSAAGGDTESVADLATVLGGALPTASSAGALSSDGGSMDSESSDSDAHEDLARQLLNLQDGGSIAYRYGTLPVLVAGQLVELDLVVLQQRSPPEGTSPVRRLAMTLQTHSFGQMRIEASALDNRLSVTFSGQSPQGTQELESYRDEVRALLGRLGWNVEAVGYELDAHPATAARHVIDHVLSAGTVNLVV